MARSDKRKRNATDSHSIFETAPKASLIMLFSGLFVLFVLTLLIINSPSPTELSVFLAPASLLSGAAFGGLFCGMRLKGGRGCACAVLSALLVTSILLVARLFVPASLSRSSSVTFTILHLSTLGAAALGTVPANITGNSKRRKIRKYRSKS